MTEFDPYLQWLGIPREQQPPDHYRLLGLRRFETDLVAIESAADQRMAKIRVYQTGPRASVTQKLLNELAAAKLCLLNPYSKAEYDGALANVAAGEMPVTDLLPMSVPVTSLPSFPIEPSPTSSHPLPAISDDAFPNELYERSSSRLGWWLPVMGILLTILVAVGVWFVKNAMDRRTADSTSSTSAVTQSDSQKITGPEESAATDSTSDPTLIMQEASGLVYFPMSVAKLNGQVALESHRVGELLVGWQTEEDSATWRFKTVKLPSQGIFRVRMTYQAGTDVEDAQYCLTVDDQELARDMRGRNRLVDDEFYVAVKGTGEHTLKFSLRNKPSSAIFGLKLLEFSAPRSGSEAPP
jgi:hypothetical protein